MKSKITKANALKRMLDNPTQGIHARREIVYGHYGKNEITDIEHKDLTALLLQHMSPQIVTSQLLKRFIVDFPDYEILKEAIAGDALTIRVLDSISLNFSVRECLSRFSIIKSPEGFIQVSGATDTGNVFYMSTGNLDKPHFYVSSYPDFVKDVMRLILEALNDEGREIRLPYKWDTGTIFGNGAWDTYVIREYAMDDIEEEEVGYFETTVADNNYEGAKRANGIYKVLYPESELPYVDLPLEDGVPCGTATYYDPDVEGKTYSMRFDEMGFNQVDILLMKNDGAPEKMITDIESQDWKIRFYNLCRENEGENDDFLNDSNLVFFCEGLNVEDMATYIPYIAEHGLGKVEELYNLFDSECLDVEDLTWVVDNIDTSTMQDFNDAMNRGNNFCFDIVKMYAEDVSQYSVGGMNDAFYRKCSSFREYLEEFKQETCAPFDDTYFDWDAYENDVAGDYTCLEYEGETYVFSSH